MAKELVPEDTARRTVTVGGYPILVTSYHLGETYYAKAEIQIPGAGARIASATEISRELAEEKVLGEARRLIEKKA